MKTYYLKIKEKFISAVQTGKKKHEYRLASPERMAIKVGDTLVLVSNQNRRNYIRVTVKNITVYKDWEETLRMNWKEDFRGIFSDIESAVKECRRFYPEEEVKAYGIVSFEIEPLVTEYCNTDILLDTNIIIRRESGRNVSFEVAQLYKWLDKKGIKRFIHRQSITELEKFHDEEAKDVMRTKLNSYEVLPAFSMEEDAYFESVISQYPKDDNGLVDNALLKEVYNDNVGLLLSEDGLVLRKAEELFIRDKVRTPAELLAIFEKAYPQNIEYQMLTVELKSFSEIDLNSPFFDSLREDYGGSDFDKWFKRKGQEKAYVEHEQDLRGFLYIKVEDRREDYSDIEPILPPGKRLKIGTFKIESSGFRLGERFLKIIFDNARKNDVDEIYVTLFENKREEVKRLQNLLEQWGFQKHGHKKSNGEAVLVKSMREYREDLSPKMNYPVIKPDAARYFLPIYPQYHTDLFPDMILKNEDIHLYEDRVAHRYAIEKIYLSGNRYSNAKPGDLVLIYRIGERIPKMYSSVVSGVAIIEEIIETRTVEECIALCKNRSIFSEEEIRKVHQKYPTIIKLLDYQSFNHKIIRKELNDHGILDMTSGPRPLEAIKREYFDFIVKLGMED